MVILIFRRKKESISGVPWETCYPTESSNSLKAKILSSNKNLNGKCEEIDLLNS
jgi:hypothetical protein